MSKHNLLQAPLPPAKRPHALSTSDSASAPKRPLSFDGSLYDELIICIFSYLSWADLCAAQATNRNWSRLAADNELWRKLYLDVYGRPRLRGARGFVGRSDGRAVRPLPGRPSTENVKDWKWMFRISSNWRRGRCTVEQLNDSSQLPLSADDPEHHHHTHVLLAGSYTIIASSRPSDTPTIHVFSLSNPTHTLTCESRHQLPSCKITALAIDQSPPTSGHLRVASFLSTGEFTIFYLYHNNLSASHRKLTYVPTLGNNRTAPIVQAVYHHPLLVTLSQTFNLSIYDLSSDSVRHSQTLTSFSSFPPTSLVLSTPTPTTYKLVIAYAIPVYPAHWSVGATELIISGLATPETPPLSSALPSSFSRTFSSSTTVDPMTVNSTRTARALDIPQGWIDDHKLRSMREQWSRKVPRVADTQTDGKWIVLAPGEELYAPSSSEFSSTLPTCSPASNSENVISSSTIHSSTTLQLYRLSLPSLSGSVASAHPKLTFVRNLHGQTGPVSSLALADGRCVSLGLNGSLWVWDLEAGTGAEVAVPLPDAPSMGSILPKGSVAFDERRIITTEANRVITRRFDV